MTLFKFSRRPPTPVVATNISLDTWCYQSCTQPTRFVHKVELCTALCASEDAWGTPRAPCKNHHHTLLRVTLAPVHGSHTTSADTFLIERVLSVGGGYHSVTPISESLLPRNTRPHSYPHFRSPARAHAQVHDRVCAITSGPSTALAPHLAVERTLVFRERDWAHLPTLAQLAQILELISRATQAIMAREGTRSGGDCRSQSRAFAFACLAALAPRLPPKERSEGCECECECDMEVVDDTTFELSAEAFLGQVPWLVRDRASVQAVKLIGALKQEPQGRAGVRLYH